MILHHLLLTIACCLFSSLSAFSSSSEPHLILMRHGQATHNLADILNSTMSHPNYTPSHLTELGRQQACLTSQKLREAGFTNQTIALAIVSPLPRAQETAQILIEEGILDPSVVTTDERLIEVSAGQREGASSAHITNWNHPTAHEYGGETGEDVRKRVLPLYKEILAAPKTGHIILISHGTPLLKLQEEISGESYRLQTAGFRATPIAECRRICNGYFRFR